MENLDLIDWRMVGFASLWILGLAALLTALGFADYHAKREGRTLRALLGEPGYQIWMDLGLALFCLGMLGSARAWWETALWAALAAAFAAYGALAVRSSRRGE
jgi:hypothetical protein